MGHQTVDAIVLLRGGGKLGSRREGNLATIPALGQTPSNRLEKLIPVDQLLQLGLQIFYHRFIGDHCRFAN